MRLLKERGREPEERREEALSGSSLSQQRSGSEKERLSLVKIKELHQENLKIAKDSFYAELRNMEEGFFGQLEDLTARFDELSSKLTQLEAFRRQAESRLEREKGLAGREQAHRESERHQEIEAVLLDKHSHFERLIQELRRDNEDLRRDNQRVAGELAAARRQAEELQARSLSYSRELSCLAPHDEQELLQSLRRENEELALGVGRQEAELASLRAEVRAGEREKERAVREEEEKLELILEEYESKIKAEREEHRQREEQLRREREEREQELQELHERDKAEIELQLKDALKLYDKENSGLKQSLLQKNSEILLLSEQLEKLKAELHQLRLADRKDSQELSVLTQENDQLRNRSLALQKSVELLSQQLEEAGAVSGREKQLAAANVDLQARLAETERLGESLKGYVGGLEAERERLGRALREAEGRVAENEEAQVEVLARFRQELDAKEREGEAREREAAALNDRLLAVLQQRNELEREREQLRSAVEALRAERGALSYATIEEELKELRAMVSDYYSAHKNRLDSEVVEDYFRLVHAHELKIDENLKLAREVEELRGQAAADGREKLLLAEKIALLENNIAIYERELRERRQLYEQVLQEKVRIEKEALLSKRIKTEQAGLVEGFRNSTT